MYNIVNFHWQLQVSIIFKKPCTFHLNNLRDQSVFIRYRIRHSRPTREFLLKGEPPECIPCNCPLTIKSPTNRMCWFCAVRHVLPGSLFTGPFYDCQARSHFKAAVLYGLLWVFGCLTGFECLVVFECLAVFECFNVWCIIHVLAMMMASVADHSLIKPPLTHFQAFPGSGRRTMSRIPCPASRFTEFSSSGCVLPASNNTVC